MTRFLPAGVSWAALGATAFLSVVACSASPASPSAVQNRVPVGSWGGIGIRLDITESEVLIEFDCANAALAPLFVDADNRFDVAGVLVLERAGPVRQGEPDRTEPARYSGRLEGDTLTMGVTLTATGGSGGTFTATRGAAPVLRKCR